MICPNCGYMMDAFDTICPRCQGKSVTAAPVTQSPPPSVGHPPINVDEILMEELGKVAGLFLRAWVRPAAARGAKFAAQRLPTGYYKESKRIRGNAPQVASLLHNVLQDSGKVSKFQNDGNSFIISGVVGSGYGNMNPCVIVFVITSVSPETSSVDIFGYAKEGLINQNTAEKAVNNIVASLPSSR